MIKFDISGLRAIGVVGAGKMATAIVKGLLTAGADKEKILVYDISSNAAAKFAAETGIASKNSIDDALASVSTVLLAVKPNCLRKVLTENNELIRNKLLISIAAGVKIASLENMGSCDRIVRVMPNIPAVVGEAMSAYTANKSLEKCDFEQVELILAACGDFCRVEESAMDAVTGVSGSGPAYVFEMIQAMADGGVNAGLPRDIALKLSAQTVLGAAKMVLSSGEHPTVLRDQVTSPGGTTAQALACLERRAFRGTVTDAVLAAVRKSEELSGE